MVCRFTGVKAIPCSHMDTVLRNSKRDTSDGCHLAAEEPQRVLPWLDAGSAVVYSLSLARSRNFLYSLDWFPGVFRHLETHKICSWRNLAGMLQELGGNNVEEISLFIWKKKWNLEKHKLL